jgi:hypothetical protein
VKTTILDKSLPVERATAEVSLLSSSRPFSDLQQVIASLHPIESPLKTVIEVEAYINLCVKSLDASDRSTRRNLASLAGRLLASTQEEREVSQTEPQKKGKGQPEDKDQITSSSINPNESRSRLLTPTEMFHQLSTHLNKAFVGRKVLVGLCEMYASLLLSLGSEYVEKNYGIIVAHFMNEFIANSRNTSTRQDGLLVRTLVGTLLRDLIGVRLLSEQGQIAAIQELSGSYLKRWPALMPGQSEPSALALTVALIEVAGLLRQLGNSPPPVQVSFSLLDEGGDMKHRSGCPI